MQDSAEGLVTSKLFLDECLTPKPLFNDGTPVPVSPVVDEHGVAREAPTLQLPRDRNGANVRCTGACTVFYGGALFGSEADARSARIQPAP